MLDPHPRQRVIHDPAIGVRELLEAGDVGVASELDNLGNGEVEAHRRVLGNDRHLPGALPVGGSSIQPDPAQQRRLAGPVGADDSGDLALFGREGDVGKNAGDGDAGVDHADHPAGRRPRSSSQRKIGEPMKATTVPVCSVTGAKSMRAIVSAATRKAAPASAAVGSKDL